MHSSSKWSLLSGSLYAFLISTRCAVCPAYLALLDLITLITLVKNASYEAPYAVFFHPFVAFLSHTPKYSPQQNLHTLSVCVPSSHWEKTSHTHTEQQQSYSFVYFNLYISKIGDGKVKDSELNSSKHSLNLIYSYLSCECSFDLLLLLPDIWACHIFKVLAVCI
jgi:hypothetical protein